MGLPGYLKLDLLDAAFAFVLDTEHGIARHDDALARHLDGEALAALWSAAMNAFCE